MSTLIHETNSNNEACNLVAARNKIIQTACRQYKSWAYTHRVLHVRISSQQTLQATPECFASYFGRRHSCLAFCHCSKLFKAFGERELVCRLFPANWQRVTVYFEHS